jgi:uncharacterized delta-60 repeat protein
MINSKSILAPMTSHTPIFTVVTFLTLLVRLAAAPGDLDPSFDAGSGVNTGIWSLVAQPDGKVIIGGEFTTVRGALRKGLARLNTDGTADLTFNPARGENLAMCLALQPDGKLLVVSGFIHVIGVNGHLRSRIVRLNADGTPDSTFDAGESPDSFIRSISICPDGKVIVQGPFTNINGMNRMNLVRLNADGSIDATFNPASRTGQLKAGYGPSIHAHAVQPDGKVIVGGSFTALDGISRNGIGRLDLDGSLDRTFDPGSGIGIAGLNIVSEGVISIAVQSDGKVLLGGRFSSINGISRPGVARINSDGSPDAEFNARLGVGTSIDSITLQPDGKVLIYGDLAGTTRFARLNSDGSRDTSFTYPFPYYGAEAGSFSPERCIALLPDGKILVGFARLKPDGMQDKTFDPRLLMIRGDDKVKTMALQPDGKVLIGGEFGAIQGERRDGIGRLNRDGSLDRAFNPSVVGWGSLGMGVIDQIAVQPNGKILLQGSFNKVGGVNRTNFVRLNADGTLDASFNPARVGTVIAAQPDDKVLIGPAISRLNADGTVDIPFTSAAAFMRDWWVYSIAVERDGKVLVGGWFPEGETEANSYHLARLNVDGSLNALFDLRGATPFEAPLSISSINPLADGKVLVSGTLNCCPGCWETCYTPFVARLNPNGTVDTTFQPPTSGTFAISPDGQIITFTVEANDRIFSVLAQPDGKVLIGGEFSIVNGMPHAFVARLLGDSTGRLELSRNPTGITISWPISFTNHVLEATPSFTSPNWQPVPAPASNQARWESSISANSPQQFFRLRQK